MDSTSEPTEEEEEEEGPTEAAEENQRKIQMMNDAIVEFCGLPNIELMEASERVAMVEKYLSLLDYDVPDDMRLYMLMNPALKRFAVNRNKIKK